MSESQSLTEMLRSRPFNPPHRTDYEDAEEWAEECLEGIKELAQKSSDHVIASMPAP